MTTLGICLHRWMRLPSRFVSGYQQNNQCNDKLTRARTHAHTAMPSETAMEYPCTVLHGNEENDSGTELERCRRGKESVERGRNCGLHGMEEMVRSYRCAYRGCGGVTPVILNLGIRWRFVDGFPSGRFSSGERAPGTN